MDIWVVITVRNPMPGAVSDNSPPYTAAYGTEEDAIVGALEQLEGFVRTWDALDAEARALWLDRIRTSSRRERSSLLYQWREEFNQTPGADQVWVHREGLRWDPLETARQGVIDTVADNFSGEEPTDQEIEEYLWEVAGDQAHSLSTDEVGYLMAEGDLSPDSEDMHLAGNNVADALRYAAVHELQTTPVADVREYLNRHTTRMQEPGDWPRDLQGVPFVLSMLQEYLAYPGNQVPGIDVPIESQWYPNHGRHQFNVAAVLPDAETLPIAYSRGRGYTHKGGFWRPDVADLDDLIAIVQARLEAIHDRGWNVRTAMEVDEDDYRDAIIIDFDGARSLHDAFRLDVELARYDIPAPESWPVRASEWAAPEAEVRMPPPSFIPTPRHRTIGAYRHPFVRRQVVDPVRREREVTPPGWTPGATSWADHQYWENVFAEQLSPSAGMICALTAIEMALPFVWETFVERAERALRNDDTTEAQRTLSYRDLPVEILALAWRIAQRDPDASDEVPEALESLHEGWFWLEGGNDGDAAGILHALEAVLRGQFDSAVTLARNAYMTNRGLELRPFRAGEDFNAYLDERDALRERARAEFTRRWWARCQERVAVRDPAAAVLT